MGEKEFLTDQKKSAGTEVRLVNLTKEFIDKTQTVTVAVNDFTTIIPAGKLIGLLGPSGCGKSTTLYMIAGLHRPTSGEIYFGEENITNHPPEVRGIGLVFQNYALYPHMTVRENISFPLQNIRPKLEKDEITRRVKDVARLVQISELLERKPNQLSGGQQQRVAIARALVKNPKVLLLDEPLSNLDARLRLQTREEIKRIQRETGVTAIFVTHDQEEAMSISDEIIVMDKGFKMQIGHPQEVYDNPNSLFVAKFLGSPQINILEGNVQDNKIVLVNGDIIGEVKNVTDQKVSIGIRPEFFELNPKGKIKVKIDLIEHIGRDIMFTCIIAEQKLKIIVSSVRGYQEGQEITLSVNNIFLFDEKGNRIY